MSGRPARAVRFQPRSAAVESAGTNAAQGGDFGTISNILKMLGFFSCVAVEIGVVATCIDGSGYCPLPRPDS